MGPMMDRRLFICMLAGAVRPAAADDEAARPRHKISAATLHDALSSRFPLALDLAGLLKLQVSAPRLLLLPARNRLGATLLARVSGPQVPPTPDGEVDVLFALRYERSDQTVRARQPEIRDLRWPGLPSESLQPVRAMLSTVAGQMGEVVLQRLSPSELALADTMGFEPDRFEVVEDGLVIHFGPKQRG